MVDKNDQHPNTRRSPSLRACIACRNAHVRCNGIGPVCERCREKSSECIWVESRRGYRGPKRDRTSIPSNDSEVSESSRSSTHNRSNADSYSTTNTGSIPEHSHISNGFTDFPREDAVQMNGYGQLSAQNRMTTQRPMNLSAQGHDQFLDSYYRNFHPGHPFVLPRKMQTENPEFLKAVMRVAGSHFIPTAAHDALKDAAISLMATTAPENAYKVQALLLLAMVGFSRNEQNEGQAFLRGAIDLALHLGMHQADFASRYGYSNATIEECLRRTWWELYIVEGLIASFTGQVKNSRLRMVRTDTLLPGDDPAYNACTPSKYLRSFQDMGDRALLDDGYQWSSFAYKVEAMHIYYQVGMLEADTFTSSSANFEILDQRISNFRMSLPMHKRDAVKFDGEVDEVMFGALMIAGCAEIGLHRPRSSFVSIQNHYRTACTPIPTPGMTAVGYLSHDAKALRAANAIINLITVPSAPTVHTPCFPCALTIAATVQLPAMVVSRPAEVSAIKERIKLTITALGAISEVWPIALATKGQIAHFAKEVIKTSKDASSLGSSSQSSANTPSTGTDGFEYSRLLASEAWLMDLFGEDGGIFIPDANMQPTPQSVQYQGTS